MGKKLLSKKAIRLFLKQKGKRSATPIFQRLEYEIENLLLKAVKRAEQNKRTTIMSQDI